MFYKRTLVVKHINCVLMSVSQTDYRMHKMMLSLKPYERLQLVTTEVIQLYDGNKCVQSNRHLGTASPLMSSSQILRASFV